MTVDHRPDAHALIGGWGHMSKARGQLHVWAERGEMDRDAAVAAGEAALAEVDAAIAELTAVKKRTAGELADYLSTESCGYRADWMVHVHQETRVVVPGQPTGDAARKIARLRYTAGDWGDLVTKEMPPRMGFASRITSSDQEDM